MVACYQSAKWWNCKRRVDLSSTAVAVQVLHQRWISMVLQAINEAQSDENDHQSSWYCWSQIHDISLQFNTSHLLSTMCNMLYTVAFLKIDNTLAWIQSYGLVYFLLVETVGIAKCKGNASYKCYSFLQQCVCRVQLLRRTVRIVNDNSKGAS